MGYDWSDKEADCFRLYVQEGKSMDDVIDWFRREKGFAPRYVLQSTVDGRVEMWVSPRTTVTFPATTNHSNACLNAAFESSDASSMSLG